MHDQGTNIFELWRAANCELPLTVVRWHWEYPRRYAVIEEVHPNETNYGKAFGREYFEGATEGKDVIKNAGSYQWMVVDHPRAKQINARAFKLHAEYEKRRFDSKGPKNAA